MGVSSHTIRHKYTNPTSHYVFPLVSAQSLSDSNFPEAAYTDTSVIGGCFDEEFAETSGQLFNMFKIGEALIVVSDLTLLELQDAPPRVRAALDEIPLAHREDVELTEEATTLAERYIAAGVVVATKRVDAQHIALATLSRVDVLVSWNFKHIVNLQRIHGYNSVNLRFGYPLLEIRTPQEVLSYEEQ